MRLALGLLAVGAVLILIVRSARASTTKWYVDGAGNLRSTDGSLVEGAYVPPPNGASDPRKAVNSPGDTSLSGYCERIYGANAQAIGKVPDKNAKYVAQANNLQADINCTAVKYAEKAVGAVIVTPAKKLWSAVF